ncbi:glycosyltransferase family 4 protein [Flavobacterium sp.]|uniref:glycosyltransferase family 4 protein n=1 Tax=Flavobacterium sp. TaxID=239 RepID=UPI0026035FAA|nr:glycosyltransferase family 4 protein [Flavobacterium sp.]
MRLIQVTASKGWRGHEQKIIYLYEAFRDFGYVEDQWIVCVKDSEVHKAATSRNMQVIALDYKGEYSLEFAKSLKKIADEKKADILFIHNSQSHTLSVLSSLVYGLKIPMVLCRTMIRRVDSNFLRKWKYNYKGIKKIICVSHPVVDVLKYAVKDHSRLCVVGSVTDIHKFKYADTGILHKEFNIPEGHLLIGNIAAFTPMKDLHTWVRTAAELHKRNFKAKYIIIGDGPQEEEVKVLARELGVESEIIFAGFRKDIPKVLPEFDLFLFTSNNEPTGGVLLEAYACRIPIVAANAGGIPEVVKDGITGLMAQVGNPVDFADKVEQLTADKNLQQQLTENGYEFLKANFTKEVIAKKMFDELNEVLVKYGTKQ